MRHVFGPVASGRLGRSLGLDLLPGKVCSMDCVYCEVGPTRQLTMRRAPYVPARNILAELRQWKELGLPLDVVTLGGSGEPCLNSELGQVIAGCREILPGVPVAVLTNATLLGDPAVRSELQGADTVLPSLDSLVEEEFQAVNRPAPGITARAVADGLLMFRQEFAGSIRLEVLLVQGINDSAANLELLRGYCLELRPDAMDVVTLTRPGTLKTAGPVDAQALAAWRKALGGGGYGFAAAPRQGDGPDDEAVQGLVLASLARRPQTVLQLASALGIDPGRMERLARAMSRAGRIAGAQSGGEIFYSATHTD